MRLNPTLKKFAALGVLLCASVAVAQTCTSPKRIVVIGSSTAAGTGANPASSAWVPLFASYVKGVNAKNEIINLAGGGYTTYQALPTGTANPSDRPAVDAAKNITAALSYGPDAIVVNLPSNDAASGFTLAETEANFQRIVATADAAHVPIWVTTTQPRNLEENGRMLLRETRDWVNRTYGSHAIDFWTTIANADGTLNAVYDSGDGIHLNNAGHSILYNRAVASGVMKSICR